MVVCLTFDTDWCNNKVFEYFLSELEYYKTKVAFYITDDFPKINYSNIFEVGIHPNIENKNYDEIDLVIKSMKKNIPQKVYGIRTHKLINSSVLNQIYSNNNIKYQSNYTMFLQEKIKPFKGLNNIIEIPIFFMDYYLMEFYKNVPKFKEIKNHFLKDGLKVLDFHPMHIYLNSYSLEYYYNNRDNLNINTKKYGIGNFFYDMMDFLIKKDAKFYLMKEVV